jgi:hypothetical protein
MPRLDQRVMVVMGEWDQRLMPFHALERTGGESQTISLK